MPDEARAGGKGRVVARFQIQRDGKVAQATIESSSGKTSLDDATLNAIRGCDPFNPLPAEFHGPQIQLRIIFFYNLPIDYTKP
jgi:TonB family protein